jgi:hypothetical protein
MSDPTLREYPPLCYDPIYDYETILDYQFDLVPWFIRCRPALPRLTELSYFLGNQLSTPTERGVRGEEGGFFEKFAGKFSGLGCQHHSLRVIQQNPFVFFLLLQQDPDLLFERLDGSAEFSIHTLCQASDQWYPEFLSHSPNIVAISYNYIRQDEAYLYSVPIVLAQGYVPSTR